MSFFDRLFAFRQNEFRTPLEDFLTELFAEWLRQVTLAGRVTEVLTDLFKLAPTQLGELNNLNSIVWETQHVIGPGDHGAEGKRPDLIGRCSNFFLIIESKIAAGFTEYQDELGRVDQLSMYQSYRRSRKETFGGLVLITHSTLPPSDWTHQTLYWRAIEKYLRAFTDDNSSTSALNYLTKQLKKFLGDNGMNGTRIDLADITAYPAYQRLTQGLSGLGRVADNCLRIALQGTSLEKLRTPRGGSGGDFIWPTFCGLTLTNDGFKCREAQLILWSGTLTGKVYEYIGPFTDGIPDLSVGIGLWFNEEVQQEARSYLLALCEKLNSQEKGAWVLDIHSRDGRGPIILLSTRRSLIDLHVQAAGCDLDDIASEFFSTHSNSLLVELSAPLLEAGKSADQFLFEMVTAE
ncbi:hypothetical protein [Pseudomonas sp. R3-18-08]|uniref:hypothetical protein n=1 Tax=Pseudomonas sp. R3-18-08 TaxID=1173283 RepID=UPI000F580D5D|nr:hypothetical protein [Pseudomonas sp. R3-18-08]AZF16988.1 hypothetical protein C4J92_3520 [Pseudomonas sp. R3-18-08]